jgi:hypothetical protein
MTMPSAKKRKILSNCYWYKDGLCMWNYNPRHKTIEGDTNGIVIVKRSRCSYDKDSKVCKEEKRIAGMLKHSPCAYRIIYRRIEYDSWREDKIYSFDKGIGFDLPQVICLSRMHPDFGGGHIYVYKTYATMKHRDRPCYDECPGINQIKYEEKIKEKRLNFISKIKNELDIDVLIE